MLFLSKFSKCGNIYLDIDVPECDRGIDTCHQMATCFNTFGSFGCMCNTGFTGNGFTCTGNLHYLFQTSNPLLFQCANVKGCEIVVM